MYMVLEYGTKNPANVPVGLRVRAVGPDGPLYAVIAWDRDGMSGSSAGPVGSVEGPVSFNGTPGMAAYAMQGAELLSLETSLGAPVTVLSARFSQKAGQDGFLLGVRDGKLPMEFKSRHDPEKTLEGYFHSNGLFCRDAAIFGGMYAVWFDDGVSLDAVNGFLSRHPGKTLGTFAEAPVSLCGGREVFRPCYLFASQEHAGADLSRWMSDDRYAARRGF